MLKRCCFLLTAALLVAFSLCPHNAQAAKKIKMSLVSGGMNVDEAAGRLIKYMGEKIPEYSNGTIEVSTFYDSQLGDPTSMVQGLQQGTVDIGVAGNAYFSGLVPQVQVFELPFMFDSYAQARAAVDGPVGRKIMEMFSKKGIKGLGFAEVGFRNVTNSIRPVKTPDDVKGIKIRTLPAPVQVKTWELFGALPTPIDVTELYAALQQGVVNAQENPLSVVAAQKFYEVQKYMSMTGHVYTPAFVGMSMRTWKKLDATQQEAVTRAMQEGLKIARDYLDESEKRWIKQCEDAGVEIEFAPQKDLFKEKAMPAYTFFTDKFGDELIKEIQAAK